MRISIKLTQIQLIMDEIKFKANKYKYMTDLIIEIRYYERGGWCNLFIHNHKLHIHHQMVVVFPNSNDL